MRMFAYQHYVKKQISLHPNQFSIVVVFPLKRF